MALDLEWSVFPLVNHRHYSTGIEGIEGAQQGNMARMHIIQAFRPYFVQKCLKVWTNVVLRGNCDSLQQLNLLIIWTVDRGLLSDIIASH